MRDIQDKTDGTGDILAAGAFNTNFLAELQDFVVSAGFTLDPEAGPDTDTLMFSKSVCNYSVGAMYFAESGAADAYVLTRSGNIESLSSYFDGAIVCFNPGNDNTGASTINIDGLGVKDLVAADGTALTGGEVVADVYCIARYNSATDDFEIVKSAGDDAATLEGHPASYFAVDSLAAHLAGTETFTGAKTFVNSINGFYASDTDGFFLTDTDSGDGAQTVYEKNYAPAIFERQTSSSDAFQVNNLRTATGTAYKSYCFFEVTMNGFTGGTSGAQRIAGRWLVQAYNNTTSDWRIVAIDMITTVNVTATVVNGASPQLIMTVAAASWSGNTSGSLVVHVRALGLSNDITITNS